MKDKHPIDKFFKDGLRDPDIPFDPKDWETLSKKMPARKKRKVPLFIWMTSGVAAALVLAAILLLNDQQPSTENAEEYASGQLQTDTPDLPRTRSLPGTTHPKAPTSTHGKEAETETLVLNKPIDKTAASEKPTEIASLDVPHLAILPAVPFPSIQNHKPTTAYTVAPSVIGGNKIPSVARTAPRAIESDETSARRFSSGQLSGSTPQRGWALGVIAAPDFSGTQPLSGKLSGNVGLMATYRLNHWLSISGGALYAKKLYQADFSDYRPDRWRGNGSISPGFVKADCAVLDVPILANATIKRFRRSDFFISTGISSYFMLRETYDYRYPPEAGREPWELTIRSQNRHLLGVGNLSVGYRQQLTPSLSLTVQPFVKAPLTGIGNGNIKLYSTGVAISADIDLTRRNR